MKTTHTFEKSFGPTASFAGIVVFIAGILATFYSISGLFMVVFGAFLGFTNTSTTIDGDNKRVRFSNNIFGIIKIGKWISLHDDMQIGIKQEKKVYRTYSRSNQSFDLKVVDKKVYLFNKNRKPILPLLQLKVVDKETLNTSINEICKELGVKRMS